MLSPTVTLNTGAKFPILGLGTFLTPKDVTKQSVITAIKCGYRHIDTASAYENEEEIGEALRECIPSIIKREDIFITTKLWLIDFEPDEVESALKVSLKKLGLDYIDLYLVHFPIKQKLTGPKRDPNDYKNWHQPSAPMETIPYSLDWFLPTWKSLESCYEKGLIKSIGVSNFSSKRIDGLLKVCKIKPSVNQFEIHPGLTQHELISYCLSKEIQVTAYCPLGNPGINYSIFNISEPLKVLEIPIIVSIANKYKKSPAQICIRWLIDRGCTVIPKSIKENRIKENFDVFDFKLSNDEIEEINKLECGYRISNSSNLLPDPNWVKEMWE